jgi:hypothetical protein
VVGRVTNIKMTFYSSGWWELGGPERVTIGGGVHSMLRFGSRGEVMRRSIVEI